MKAPLGAFENDKQLVANTMKQLGVTEFVAQLILRKERQIHDLVMGER